MSNKTAVLLIAGVVAASVAIPALAGTVNGQGGKASIAAKKKKKKAQQVPGLRGPQGPAGPQGSQGTQGAQGPAGTFKAADLTVASATNNAGDYDEFGQVSVTATCPQGKRVISGGFNVKDTYIDAAYIDMGANGYVVKASDFDDPPDTAIDVYAYCAPAS